jgi:hypothetical protein
MNTNLFLFLRRYNIFNINNLIEFLNFKQFLIIGGASKEETDSGLFIYSKIPFINIKTKNENVNSDNDNNENNNHNFYYENTILKESWDFNKSKFEWKNNEDLLSNPRIISQVSV